MSFKRPQFAAGHSQFMTSEQKKGQTNEVKKFEEQREYKCPNCGKLSHFMGQDFKAPKRSDAKAWKEVQKFIESGKIYYRGTE